MSARRCAARTARSMAAATSTMLPTRRGEAIATTPYGEPPDFPATGGGGHAGQLVVGHVGPTPVAVLQGRAHYDERGRADEMKGAIRAMAALGCETLLQTNAAGSLRLGMAPGSPMGGSGPTHLHGGQPPLGEAAGSGRLLE